MVVCPHCKKEISSIKCESISLTGPKQTRLFSKKAKTRKVYVCPKCSKILAFDYLGMS